MGLQLQGLNMLSQAKSTCASVQVLIKSKDLATLSTSMKTRRISPQQTEAVIELRQVSSAFSQWCESIKINTSALQSDALHVTHLDNLAEFAASQTALKEEVQRIEAVFSASWTQDICSLTRSISAVCPQWEAFEATLLSHRTLIEEMKKMSPSHYNNIGPLVNTLTKTLKLVKAVQGSPMVEGEHIT